MVQNRLIICLSAITLLLASCDANNGSASPNDSVSVTQTVNNSKDNERGKDTIRSTPHGLQKHDNLPQPNTSTILPYLSLGGSILSLLLVIIVLKKSKQVREEDEFKNNTIDRDQNIEDIVNRTIAKSITEVIINDYRGKGTISKLIVNLIKQTNGNAIKKDVWDFDNETVKEIIGEFIVDNYNNRGKIYNLIDNHNKQISPQPDVAKQNIEAVVNKIIDIDVIVDRVVDRVMECLGKNEDEDFESIRDGNLTQQRSTSSVIIYASSADKNRNSFFKTTLQPDEDTLYKLCLAGERAYFEIYDGVFDKVLQAPDCLECACEVQRLGGNQTVITAESGTAEKQADGTWRITSKAKVKFK